MGARAAELVEHATHAADAQGSFSLILLPVISKLSYPKRKKKIIICSMASREQLHWFQKEV